MAARPPAPATGIRSQRPEHDGKVLAQWLPAGVDTGADLDRTCVIEVDYPALAAFDHS